MPLQITFRANEIDNFCRVDPGQDGDLIDTLKEAAIDEAEGFLNTDFSTTATNDDGTTTTQANEAPTRVKQWVLNRIAEMYEGRGQEPKADFTGIKQFRKFPFRG